MNQNNLSGERKLDKTEITIYTSLVILLLALTSFNFITSDFQISIGVIFLSVFLFAIPEFPMIPVTVTCSIGIIVVRSIVSSDPVNYVAHSLTRYLPETVFYLVYGLLLYVAYKFFKDKMEKSFAYMVLIIAVIDYLSNTCELLIRVQGEAFTEDYQITILAAAVIRAIAAWFIIFFFKKYRATLVHYDRIQIANEQSAKIDAAKNVAFSIEEKVKKLDVDDEIKSMTTSLIEKIDDISLDK